jgi:hypothetical protein
MDFLDWLCSHEVPEEDQTPWSLLICILLKKRLVPGDTDTVLS